MSWDFHDREKMNFLAAQTLVDLAARLMRGDVNCYEFPEITRGIEPKEEHNGLVHYGPDGTETLRIVVKDKNDPGR